MLNSLAKANYSELCMATTNYCYVLVRRQIGWTGVSFWYILDPQKLEWLECTEHHNMKDKLLLNLGNNFFFIR